jgi:hypothetical protein
MKTYKILVLGASGSGKTFFLASMFKRLAIQNNEIGFFLDANPTQKQALINLFHTIADPHQDWPPGTQRSEMKEWSFICSIKSERGNTYPIFNFTYLDYAGGIITEDGEEIVKFEKEARNADSLLVLIDGQKILYHIQGKEYMAQSIEYDLSHLLPIVGSMTRIPIHFIVTKWDLFEKYGYSLGKVREFLLNNEDFKNVIEQRSKMGIPVRLIPVSSLGREFAEPDQNGVMKKVPNKIPIPFQVEVPLACTLIDKFEAEKNKAYGSSTAFILLFRQTCLRVLPFAIKIMGYILPIGILTDRDLTDIIHNIIQNRIKRIKREQGDFIRMVRNRDTALLSMLNSYDDLILKLEHRFPDSSLS